VKRAIIILLVIGLLAAGWWSVSGLLWRSKPNTLTFSPQGLMFVATRDQFKSAPAGCGTVNPKARVAVLRAGAIALYCAVDSAAPEDETLNVVRIDAAVTGRFDGALVLPFRPDESQGEPRSVFGPGDTVMKVRGQATPVRVTGGCVLAGAAPILLQVNLEACIERSCSFGPKTYRVSVIDATDDLSLTEGAGPLMQNGAVIGLRGGDALVVNAADGQSEKSLYRGWVGQPVYVDGAWWDVTVSPDLATISASPSTAPLGRIKVAATEWTTTLIGSNRVLAVGGGPEAVDVPAGRYLLGLTRLQSGGAVAYINGMGVIHNTGPVVDVVTGQVADVAVGPPFATRVAVSGEGRQMTFAARLEDVGGRDVDGLISNSSRVGGQFKVFTAAGKQVYSAALEFG
jgi:hypothetical protein